MQREMHDGDAAVHASLRALHAKELLAVEGESWEFHSELVREVAYGTMTKQRRAKVHAGIASWLEREEYEHHDAVIDAIAHHYGRAAALSVDLGATSGTLDDVVARAVDWLRRAGERAARADTPRRAALLFSEALTLLDTPAVVVPTAAEAAVRGRVSSSWTGLRPTASCARSCRLPRTPRRRWLSPKRPVTSPRRCGPRSRSPIVLRSGTPDEAEPLLGAVLARAAAAGDDRGRAAALRVRGFAALLRNDPEAAVASLEPALEIYTAQRDRLGRAWALQNLSWAHFIAGRIHDAESLLHDSAALSPSSATGAGWAGPWACWPSPASTRGTRRRRRRWPRRSSAWPARPATAGPSAWARC